MTTKTNEIKFEVTVDANFVPEKILWEAEGSESKSECKASMITLWDEKQKNTLRIDLWTKDMTVNEMKQFFHQTLLTMSDTFERATNEDKMAGDMRDFSAYFAEKMGLIDPQEN